jgi:hypothetical protein
VTAWYLVRIIHHRLHFSSSADTFSFVCRNVCDPDGTGSLDRDAFVRGMARIDEELRRTQ